MELEVGPASPIPIMEYIVGYIPPKKHPSPVARKVPLRPSGKCRVDEPRISQASKGKQEMKKQIKEKGIAMPLVDEEKEDFETRNLLPPYIPPRRTDLP